MSDTKKTIEVSEDLYNALQELKQVFSQLTWQEIKSDDEVIGILVSGFVDSIQNLQGDENNDIITKA